MNKFLFNYIIIPVNICNGFHNSYIKIVLIINALVRMFKYKTVENIVFINFSKVYAFLNSKFCPAYFVLIMHKLKIKTIFSFIINLSLSFFGFIFCTGNLFLCF